MSKLTPRSWFRAVMSAAALWVVAGHWVTPYAFSSEDVRVTPAEYAVLQRVQNHLAITVQTLLTVVSVAPTWMQGRINALAPSPPGSPMTREELQERIRSLANENAWLISQLGEANRRIGDLRGSGPVNPDSLVSANITAMSAGPSVDTIAIDVGSNQGLVTDMAVIKSMSLIGRVKTVGPVVSTVVLTTDATMKIRAKIVQPEGFRPVTECLIRGSGNGTMTCDTISAVAGQAFAPSKGDLLVLADERWPVGVQNMVLGEVIDVRAEVLKYNLTIAPRVRVTTPMYVAVLKQ